MSAFISILFVVVGLIHLAPLLGVLGQDKLAQLYGISLTDANLTVLMQHRAVLFGLLGISFMIAVVKPQVQWPIIVAGLVSTISFLIIAAIPAEELNASMSKVLMADKIAVACLLIAAAAKWVDS